MKTLVLHPKDYSTDFLSKIYSEKDWTVISDRIPKSKLKQAIKDHDRVIMMGHGCGKGLFDSDFNTVIDSNYLYLLREKYCIGIWCDADVFFEKYDLKGLYTGMIISESAEALLCGVDYTYREIEKSNILLSESFKEGITDYGFDYDKILEIYKGDSQTIQFNSSRIYTK